MSRTIIIAEAGVNHNGDIGLAFKLIDAAAEAGADYIKFQTFKASKIARKTAPKATYQVKQGQDADESQYEMLSKLELTPEMHETLIQYCGQKGITFLSTPFDMESIDLLTGLGIKIGKIPSGEITNLPYLRKMAKSFEHLILSTGMADLQEVENALRAIREAGKPLSDITVLHCTSEYPAPLDEVNLFAMTKMAQLFNVAVGYSDHTEGIEVPIAATALGAKIIEKHFTLDRLMEGPDHAASLEPEELIEMVKRIRNVEKALGNGDKVPTNSEKANKLVARKSIVAAVPISRGDVFTDANLTVKRPGTGVSPMRWDEVVGRAADRDYNEDDPIII